MRGSLRKLCKSVQVLGSRRILICGFPLMRDEDYASTGSRFDHMTDDDSKGSKIVPLFPARAREAVDERPQASSSPTPPDELAAVVNQVEELLTHAEPALRQPSMAQAGPDPGHRNAMRCPQCDQYTWRQTAHCMHCGTDLVAHAAQLEAVRLERRQGVWWSCAIASWAIAMGCIYVTQHYALPPRIQLGLRYAVFGIFGVNLLGFWIASMGRRS